MRLLTLGELVRGARLRAGLSYSRLAKLSGVDRSTLYRIERDDAQGSAETLMCLVNALGLDAGEVLECAARSRKAPAA